MTDNDMNEYQFSQLPNTGEKLLTIFKDIKEIKAAVRVTNGKVSRHDRNLIIVDVILVVIGGTLIYFFTGQVPAIPFW